MAKNNTKNMLVVLDKYQGRVAELVVVIATGKNKTLAESSKETYSMQEFIAKQFSSKLFCNIFDADRDEFIWESNPKIGHIQNRCLELWGPKQVEPEEEELDEEESVEEEPAEEAASDDSESAEESVEEESAEESVEEESAEEPAEEADSDDSEPAEESKDLFAAARQAAANRKSSTTPKKVEKPSKPSTKKAESELEEDLDEDDEPKKSGFLVWVLALIAVAIVSVSVYLTLKPGREMETLGLTAQYTEATHRLNREVEPAWYRWESWDRSVAAEATLTWGPYFRALYVEGEGKNPTPNSIQLYAVYLTMKVLVQQGHEPGEALRIIREEGSKSVISALNKGSISNEDIAFIREYMMK